MKLEARFLASHFKPPQIIDHVERLKISYGAVEVELVVDRAGGLSITANQPLGDALIVMPKASNVIAIYAGRAEDIKK